MGTNATLHSDYLFHVTLTLPWLVFGAVIAAVLGFVVWIIRGRSRNPRAG